jgi:hypothetical protein
MRRLLAVHPDLDMLELMDRALSERLTDVVLEGVRNVAAATRLCRAQMDDPFHVVIVNYNVAADLKTQLNDGDNSGIQFLESLGNFGHGDAPKILIAPTATNSLVTRLQEVANSRLLPMENPATFEDAFVAAVGRALDRSSESPDEVRKQVKVVLSIDLERQYSEYQLTGVGFTYVPRPGTLQIDYREFRRIINRSSRAGEHVNEWEQELLEIGQDFGKLLLYGNPDFLTDLKDAQAKAGGEENKSICFSIERSVHPAALEALTDPREESFWMLKVPMYRRLIRPGQSALERQVLFKGQSRGPEPFSALIIESPVEGLVENLKDKDNRRIELKPLGNVTPEADEVERVLRRRAHSVERIAPTTVPAGSSFQSCVQEALKRPWDLVHYAGHSYYHEGSGKGYLFFPGEFGAEALDIEMFNTYLNRAKTRFVYLSGCQSSESGFVFELAKLQIPGVLGFRWPINDSAALEFAGKFYEELFKGALPCLEKAFLATRCAMRSAFKQDKIWAAAMLILQDPD